MASALSKTVTVQKYVVKIQQAVWFIQENAKSDGVDTGTLLDLVGILEGDVRKLCNWFYEKKSSREYDAQKEDKLVGAQKEDKLVGAQKELVEKRIEDFFFARVPYSNPQDGKDEAHKVAVCLIWFRNELQGYRKKWRKMEGRGRHKNVRRALVRGDVRDNLYFLALYLPTAMRALENVVSSRTKEVEKSIRDSSKSRPEDVGEYMAVLLGSLPHNDDEKDGVPIWRGEEPEPVGGGT